MRKSMAHGFRLTLMLFALAIPRVSSAQIEAVGSPEVARVAATLETEIRRAMLEGDIPSVTIALTDREGELWSAAFGESNLWAHTPATTRTVYLIGSTFKAQSTVALLQQMEQGKFELDDPVHDYLDGLQLRGEDPDNPVRFRHILTHTSGIPGDFGPHLVWGETAPLPLDRYLTDSLRVATPPLEAVVYSNMASRSWPTSSRPSPARSTGATSASTSGARSAWTTPPSSPHPRWRSGSRCPMW
jgi:CubicO group peptidase (beta-lactamase class C family)